MKVTVFGGSSPKPGEQAYQQALRLGKLLGEAGYTILNGGYTGTMEAVSRGSNQAGGTVIGVTCEQIESWRTVRPNPWITEEMRYATQRQRLHALIDNCEAAIALPGGIGTLAEIAEMWSNMQTGAIPSRPLILVGPEWREVFKRFYTLLDEYILEKYRLLLIFAGDVEEAVARLEDLS
jgi:uncharacterized protein (TIGR00730 family)